MITWYLSTLASYLLGLVSSPWSWRVESSSLLIPNTEQIWGEMKLNLIWGSQLRFERLPWVHAVWGEWICTRQSSRRFDLVETRLMILLTPHISKQFVYTRMSLKSELWLASYLGVMVSPHLAPHVTHDSNNGVRHKVLIIFQIIPMISRIRRHYTCEEWRREKDIIWWNSVTKNFAV